MAFLLAHPYPNQRGIWPNFRSPLVVELLHAITAYLTGSVLFLFLPMIPISLVGTAPQVRHRCYRVIRARLARHHQAVESPQTAMEIMAIAILPVAVSVHTIHPSTSRWRPSGWHSAIFGLTVAGAIFSGIGALIIAMAFLCVPHLENTCTGPFRTSAIAADDGSVVGILVFAERLRIW